MKHEEPDQEAPEIAVIDARNGRENRDGGKMIAGALALTSHGFLILEGTVCLLSRQSSAWHQYVWFAVTAAGTTVLFALLLRSFGGRQSPASVLRVLLGSAIGIYLALALVYLVYLVSVGGSPDMLYYIIVPFLILATTLAVQIDTMRKILGVMEGPDGLDWGVGLPEVWKAVAAMLSFALVIVLAFAWSWASPLGRPVPPAVAEENYAILYGIIGAMCRLLLLSVVHAVFLYLSSVRPLAARTVQIVSWSALAVWRYAPALLAAVQGSGMQYSFFWTLSVVAPGFYASVLMSRLLSRLPRANNQSSGMEQESPERDDN